MFKGLGCFSTPPQIITDNDYKDKQIRLFESDIHIFVYNIDKFNKDGAEMKKVNEVIGDSFYQYLSNLPDLVLIMDESHHYRAEKGAQALNELNPLLGLELTATPLVTKGAKQVPFKNVVFGIRCPRLSRMAIPVPRLRLPAPTSIFIISVTSNLIK